VTIAHDLRARLSGALPAEQHAIMCDGVRGEVMRILRIDAESAPSRHDRLMDLGLDSLMAVQLRNALSTMLELERPLPSTLVFDYPTIDAIAVFLLDRTGLSAATPREPAAAPRSNDATTIAASTIAAMSDDEIAATLLAREDGA
jgi:acyl carrier protein